MLNNPFPKGDEDSPTVFNYPIAEVVKLVVPTNLPDVKLASVISGRHSSRKFGKLSLEHLSDVLWLSAKVKNVLIQSNGYILTHRPSPSAGGRHPIDILVLSPALEREKLYYYNSFEHSLNQLSVQEQHIETLMKHLNEIVQIEDGTILWFVAHPERTAAKYENPESLIWRDAGALIYCVQLACTAYSLNSCPVGSLGEPFISQMFANFGNVYGTGGLFVG